MRHIGSIESEQQADRFQAWLDANAIGGRVEAEGDEWAVWIHHEDHVDRAREEFAAFQQDPESAKYSEAVETARKIHKENAKKKRAQQKVVRAADRWNSSSGGNQFPVTFGLIAICVIVTMLTNDPADVWNFGDREQPVMTWLRMEPLTNGVQRPGLSAIMAGQVWRLVTPIFLHFDIFHLLFNLLWIQRFGTQIEYLRGSLRLFWLVMVIAVISNYAQYHFVNARFGGISGVVFGLFGYVWMKTRHDPQSGFGLQPDTVVWMMGFFVLCYLEIFGGVANWCHGAGLIVGMAIGSIPPKRR